MGSLRACSQTGSGAHDIQWGTGARDTSTACIRGVTAKDPKLRAPAANGGPTLTMMPSATSPALKAGRGCEPVDQRGMARSTSVCDLGAVQRA